MICTGRSDVAFRFSQSDICAAVVVEMGTNVSRRRGSQMEGGGGGDLHLTLQCHLKSDFASRWAEGGRDVRQHP